MSRMNGASSIGTLFEIFRGLLLLSVSITGIAAGQNPVPLINQPLVPDAVKPGGPAFTLTVNGTGFVSGAVVNWNGSPLPTTFVSRSRLTASVPAYSIRKSATAAITVSNPNLAGASSPVFFEVTPASSAIDLAEGDFGTGAEDAIAIAVGDFNGDGKLDLVLANGLAGIPGVR